MPVRLKGVQNSVAVPSIIANEALYRLKHNLILPRIANRTYEKYFNQKVGDEITIKRPYQAKVQKGRIFQASAMIDKTITVKLEDRYHFGLQAVDEDFTLNIVDYGQRYLQTGAEELAYQYDIAGAKELAAGFFYTDGTPGTALQLSVGQAISAHAETLAIPQNTNCYALLNPYDIAQISDSVINLDSPMFVEDAVRRKFKGEFVGWGLLSSTHVPNYVVPAMASNTAPLVNGANQSGNTLAIDGFGSFRGTLPKGLLFQIAGVNEIQPRGDRRVTGKPATFTLTEDVDVNGGSANLPIWPEINDGSARSTIANPSGKAFDDSADANLDYSAFQTVSGTPADNAVITILGFDTSQRTTEQRYRQGMFFCGDALEYINVTLAQPKSAVYAGSSTDEETGVSMTYLSDFNAVEMTEMERLDIFFGVKTIYPEIGIRWLGPKI